METAQCLQHSELLGVLPNVTVTLSPCHPMAHHCWMSWSILVCLHWMPLAPTSSPSPLESYRSPCHASSLSAEGV